MSYQRAHSILCVEDDPLVRRALVGYLRARGYRVTAAASVAQARDLSLRVRWSGFVSDHVLGDGTGLELLAWLRRAHPDVPAALLTGEASAEVANRCARDRVHYLRKPIDLRAFEPFLERVDAYQRAPSYPSLQAMSVHIEASPREQELLRLALAERLRQSEIAERMGIKKSSVRTMVKRLLRKAGDSSLASLRDRVRSLRDNQ